MLFPEAALGADVLVGFPGETQRRFLNTLHLVEELPLTYLHVFPFSPRPGTPAADMPGRIPGDEMKKRARMLQDIGTRKRRQFRERFLGQSVEVLVESAASRAGWLRGTTANYLQVLFPAGRVVLPGSIVRVQVVRSGDRELIAAAPAGG